MAFLAFALAGASLELPFVRIGLVTVRAPFERDRFAEIGAKMALAAVHFRVKPEQRIFRLRMVKRKCRQYFLPARGGVARFAPLLERTFVRIDMARGATIKFHVFVARRPARHIGFVALFASNLRVQPGQRVSRS